LGWVVIAIAFAAVWVYAFYREDFKNPEPLWLLGLVMLGGMIAVPVASRIEAMLSQDPTAMTGTFYARAGLAMLVAGPVEETAKFIAVALLIWFQSSFDEPMDGIVYAAAGAAGFALLENLLFMQDQPASILARGPAATGAHIFFAGFWGGALGHAKQMKSVPTRTLIVAAGLALGFLSHGLFDLTTWSVDKELSLTQARLVQVGLILACAAFVRWRIRVALLALPAEPSQLAEPRVVQEISSHILPQ
jgi:RsiW-degrading membrane proteinase PrsW (M82 family)